MYQIPQYSIPNPELRRYEIERYGRVMPQVLNITADVSRIYPRNRLWFVYRDNILMATMALCSDDAWMNVDDVCRGER